MNKFYLSRLDLYKENFALFISIFLNFWIWRILELDKLMAVLLILLTFFLFNLIIKRNVEYVYFFITFSLFIIISFALIRTDFNKSLFLLSPEDQVKLNERHAYYAKEFGIFFLNSKVLNYYKNYSPIVSKFESNLFSNLDLNLYFFASHPRERAGINEFEKFSYLLLPFFIFGIIQVINKKFILSAGYIIIALLISSFVSPNYKLGPILFFPIISISIVFGLINFLTYIKIIKNEA